jgi:hypothetical protein
LKIQTQHPQTSRVRVLGFGVPQPNLQLAQALVELLIRVVKECQEDIEKGVAITVEKGRIRMRHLPLLPAI